MSIKRVIFTSGQNAKPRFNLKEQLFTLFCYDREEYFKEKAGSIYLVTIVQK